MPRFKWDASDEMFSHTFSFLNQTASIWNKSTGKMDWEYSGEGGLWLDNLHYMRYWDGLSSSLTTLEEECLLSWLRSWEVHLVSASNSKALTPPYNASERAYSLGRFLLTHRDLANKELDSLIKLVIARDLNYVASHLEFHLGGNHLLKNLMSLAWGVCLFEGADARKWQKILDQELSKELNFQILDDGFHSELSPMYHNIALLDILDIINISGDGLWRDRLIAIAKKMIAASMLVTHPDGDISFFNDCFLDSCPRSVDIIRYGKMLCGDIAKPDFLPNAGFYSLQSAGIMNVIVKAGPLGAEEQMGHAHSDLFSFEMCINNQMLFVNSGTSTYYDQPYRDYERSSSAHNTSVIAGYVQCQHWAYFRVASRSRPVNVTFQLSVDRQATLSGTVELIGKTPRPKFTRSFKTGLNGAFVITDTVTTLYSGISSQFHLHPAVRIISVDEERRRVFLEIPGGQAISFEYSIGRLTVEDCFVSREFNMRKVSKKLVISNWGCHQSTLSLEVNIQLVFAAAKPKTLFH